MANVDRNKVPFSKAELAATAAREVGRAVVNKVKGGSGMAASAGRTLAGRAKRVDAASSWGDNAKPDVRRK